MARNYIPDHKLLEILQELSDNSTDDDSSEVSSSEFEEDESEKKEGEEDEETVVTKPDNLKEVYISRNFIIED